MNLALFLPDRERPDGFDLGALVLSDPLSQELITDKKPSKIYMVFVELVTVFDFLKDSLRNQRSGTYILPDGTTVRYSAKERHVSVTFEDRSETFPIIGILGSLQLMLSESERLLSQAGDQTAVLEDIKSACDGT